jgi:small Trp-rich protein
MALVFLGVLGLLLKWLELGPVAGWSWWAVLSPFALAPVWWWFSDITGRTRRLQEAHYQARRKQRRQDTIDAMGRKSPLPRRR